MRDFLESIRQVDCDVNRLMIRKHSATLHGHRTSFSLEDEFWAELKTISASRSMSLAALISEIDDHRSRDSNLSSALRLHVLSWAKAGCGGRP